MSIEADAMYYIAVDGGASKTELCVYNTVTKSQKHFFSSCSNYKNPESDAKKALIDDGIYQVFKDFGIGPTHIKGLVMALSGCDSQKDYEYFMNIADLSGITHDRIYVGNDCEIAFFSKGNPPGISVVAGTGSIAAGIDVNLVKSRSGGWGSLISDEGSGAWIGVSVIKDLLKYYDGYGEYRNIFDLIREQMGERTFDDLPGKLSLFNIMELAGFAKLVMGEADRGDGYCLNLTNTAAGLLAEISYSVYRKLNFLNEESIDLIMSGSLFKNKIFCKTFKSKLNNMTNQNNICFYSNDFSPVMAGIALAHKLFSNE